MMSATELLEGCGNPELFGPNSNKEKRIAFIRKAGLVVDPKIDDPQHYFDSEKEFLKSNKYYGYIKGQEGLISYKG